MTKHFLTLLFLAFLGSIGFGQPQFVTPVEGVYGEDYIIVNYVDWSIDSIHDHHCGSKAYDGHQGTDFVLKSFKEIDEGVNVLAADSGVVTFILDGEFDRQTESVISRGLGNYVAIRHSNDVYTYYGHLRKNSINVQVGQQVDQGQVIGQIASSGNSTDPHLHFEVWFDSMYVIDPFLGPCGNPSSMWLDPLPYDTSYFVLDHGTVEYLPEIDSLRERVGLKDTFYTGDDLVCFWNLQTGVRLGDSSRIDWYTPSGDFWFSFTNYYTQDWWYFYYYSYINTPPNDLIGEWTYRFFHNDEFVLEDNFFFEGTSANNESPHFSPKIKTIGNLIEVSLPTDNPGFKLRAYDMHGRPLIEAPFNRENMAQVSVPRTGTNQLIYIQIESTLGNFSQGIVMNY